MKAEKNKGTGRAKGKKMAYEFFLAKNIFHL